MEGLVALALVPKTKGLSPEENAELRQRLRGLIATQFEGVEANAAPALEISQPYLNQFLNGDKGAGVKMVRAIERLEKKAAPKTGPRWAELPVREYRPAPRTTDPISEDWAMRWRALQELIKHGRDLRAAYEVVKGIQFDGDQRPPTWGDVYSKASDELDGAPAEIVDQKQLPPANPPKRSRHAR